MVTTTKRDKYVDEWTVQGWYGYRWEDLHATECIKEARGILKDYIENEKDITFRLRLKIVSK